MRGERRECEGAGKRVAENRECKVCRGAREGGE